MGIPLVILVLILGLFLIAKGWPRRRGSDPHCRACDYLLIGIVSDRCPECGGAITPQSIVQGERARREGFLFAGYGLVLLTLTLAIVGITSNFQWYHLKPAFLVMRDLDSGNAVDKSTAVRELIRRDQAGSLSTKYRDLLVAQALKDQATTSTTFEVNLLLNYLGQRLTANGLSLAQRTQFLQQSVVTSLLARPQIAPGDPVPFRSDRISRTPNGFYWVNITEGPMTVDGNPILNQGGGQSKLSGVGAGGSSSGLIPAQPPGHHILEDTLLIDVYSLTGGTFPLLHTEKRDSAPFDVLTAEPMDYLKETDDPTLAPSIQASIRLISAGFTGAGYLEVNLDVTSVPASVAFQTYARVNGKEFPLSDITLRKGESGGWHVGGGDIPKPSGPIDIILRSNPTIAHYTVDVNEIWKGEILYPSVPLTTYKGN